MKTLLAILALSFGISMLHAGEPALGIHLVSPTKKDGLLEKKVGDETLWLEPAAAFTSADIKTAAPTGAGNGNWALSLTFTESAAKRLGEFSGQHIGSKVAIVSYGKVLMAPVLRDAITGGKVEISGRFTLEELRKLADTIQNDKDDER